MQITFDPEKDRINQQKHGLSLADAEKLEWSELFFWSDDRFDYGEPRVIGYAPIGQRLYCVVYVDRGDVRRIISLRKANPREVKFYAANN
ncbi:BrnT family toxin [Methylomonas sp. DH-1]|uniref:BrnT family toxin n=1 Tax=Methylomonas sp. (strain DH-1) TaxID=1727196 RepID=UPI0009EDD565|nr:BrnT family toxin [Methylomonas sp. DH-1]